MSETDLLVVEREPKPPIRWVPLLLFQVASYMAGFIGSFATNQGLSFWYQTLKKPTWNPPNWLFAPVWTLLYFLLGYAAYLVWQSPPSQRRTAGLVLFALQMVLNALWSWLFFGFHMLYVSVLEIDLMWLAAAVMALTFYQVRPKAGLLILPYLAWIAFAAGLNYAIWELNTQPTITMPKTGNAPQG